MATFLRNFVASPASAAGAAIFLLLLVCAALAPLLAPQNPYDLSQIDILASLLPPGSDSGNGYVYWLGTDDQGRDLVSGILYGLRISIVIATLATAVSLIIGVATGLSAAYFGGRCDGILMRIVDLQLALPSVLTALVLVALLGPGLEKVLLAIVAAQWAYFARTLRSAAIVERTKDYIKAARTLRYPPWRIMLIHLLPNSVAPLAVITIVEFANAIALEATLSFLGVGLPVTEPSLGLLIANGYSYMLARKYWVSVCPGMILLLLLISVNLLGERLRQMNNPRA